MGVDCEIKFDDFSSNVVYAGENVAGTINIKVHNVVKVRKLTLHVEGIGNCDFKITTYGTKSSSTTKYEGREKYLNTITYMIPNETDIQPGRYLYKFMFQVPEGAPSSIQESNGKIFYRVRVVFDRPWKIDLEFKKDFVVTRQFDLNLDSQFRNPIEERKYFQFGFWLFKSDYVTLVASIPQNGYVVGETIIIEVCFGNPTSVEFSDIETILKKHVEYTSQTPWSTSKTKENSIHYVCHKNFFENICNNSYVKITIPDTIPSTNSSVVKVIKVYYSLVVIAKTKGMHKNLKVSIPITIGTVPIATTESNSVNEL